MTSIYKVIPFTPYPAIRRLLLVISVALLTACYHGSVIPDMGVLPDFPATTLPVLDGTNKSLEEYQGESGVVVFITNIWCDIAIEVIKDYPAIARNLGNYNISAVIINIGNPADQVREHYTEKKYGLPVLYDTGDDTRSNWQIKSVPTVAYITREGKIAYQGIAHWEKVSSAINRVLNPDKSLSFDIKGTDEEG